MLFSAMRHKRSLTKTRQREDRAEEKLTVTIENDNDNLNGARGLIDCTYVSGCFNTNRSTKPSERQLAGFLSP
jgi:hypothetical protein